MQTQARLGDMGQVFLVGAVGGTLDTLLGGRLYDRLRGHAVLGTAQIVSGLLMMCIPFAPTLGWLLVVVAGLRMVTMAGSPQAAHPVEREPGATQPRPIPYSVVLAAALFLFSYVGAEIAFGGWVYTYAVELKLAAAVQAAYLTSAFWLAFTVGRLVSVPLATRFAPRQIITVALLGRVVSMGLVFAFADFATVLYAAALAVGFCMAPVYPSGLALAVQGFKLTAQASSIILLGDSCGGMVLPWLVGQVLEAAGPRAMVYLVLSSLVCDVLAFVGLLCARSRLCPAGRTTLLAAADRRRGASAAEGVDEHSV